MQVPTRVLCIYGPPGTGKTRNLAAIFAQAAAAYGSQRCGAVTYTRAAGQELKNRLAPVLGVAASQSAINVALPYVGTIHSLCYHALGAPAMVDAKSFALFCADVHIEAPRLLGWEERVDDIEALPSLEVKDEEAEAFRMLLGAARHRMISIEEMFSIWVDGLRGREAEAADLFSPARIKYLADKYDLWKRHNHLYDFEDLLEEGARSIPPIRFLICDEVQDNSKLMWQVVDTWGKHCDQLVLAGDPFQSIYLFSGADPRLFMDHSGERVLLRESHRLTQESVEFATGVLRAGGWDPDEVGEWFGQEEPKGTDGTTFYLARTHRLLAGVRRQLLDGGEPFTELRGTAPWESVSGQAYRTLTALMAGETRYRSDLGSVVKALRRRGKMPISKKQGDELIRDRGRDPIWEDDARAALGGAELPQLRERLEHYEYLRRVEVKYGAEGLWFTPKISIGTIHCSPPGEPILTANRGQVPIEELRNEDRLMSYGFQGVRRGFEFTRTARFYEGRMLRIETERSTTKVTPNHKVMAYYDPASEARFLVYLMRKGCWWRMGQTRLRRVEGEYSWGLTRRMGNERADDVWVIKVCDSRQEAIFEEARLAAIYGIPAVNFGYAAGRDSGKLTKVEQAVIWDEASNAITPRAHKLLEDHSLYVDLPFYSRGNHHLRSEKRMFEMYAANLFPELFQLIALDGLQPAREAFTVFQGHYHGTVYDLEVAPHHTYFSGGLLVHNSAKGREADTVNLIRSWAFRPAAALEEEEGRRGEACVAYVGATRHRVALNLIEAEEGIDYDWPVRALRK